MQLPGLGVPFPPLAPRPGGATSGCGGWSVQNVCCVVVPLVSWSFYLLGPPCGSTCSCWLCCCFDLFSGRKLVLFPVGGVCQCGLFVLPCCCVVSLSWNIVDARRQWLLAGRALSELKASWGPKPLKNTPKPLKTIENPSRTKGG